jgi:hypothetical protein
MYKGCLLSCTELTLKRSVGLDSLQRLIGVPPGSSGLSASRKVVTSSRWLPPKTFWGPGEKDKALTASVSKGSRIVDVMMLSEVAEHTVGSRQEAVENVDRQVDVEERWNYRESEETPTPELQPVTVRRTWRNHIKTNRPKKARKYTIFNDKHAYSFSWVTVPG